MALQISNQFLEYVQEKDIDIDDKFIQIFYNSISIDTWIDYERALQYLQYERRDNFIKQLKKNVDFREIQNNKISKNSLLLPGGAKIHGGQNKKYYLISPDTFKSLLLLRNNEIGKRYRQYMITLEKLFKEFILFIHEKQEKRLAIKDKKILKAKDEQQKLMILSQEDKQKIDDLQNQLVIQKIEHEEEYKIEKIFIQQFLSIKLMKTIIVKMIQTQKDHNQFVLQLILNKFLRLIQLYQTNITKKK